MAVSSGAVSGGAIIDATPTWKKIRRLQKEGFTKGEIAVRLGAKQRALQIRDDFILASTAMRVDRLYTMIMRG